MNKVFIFTGVAGSGKTTLGMWLAESLGIPYADGDDFHPPGNIRKMKLGSPLSDEDRIPWLESIAAYIDERLPYHSLVVSCSALKESYREILTASLSPFQVQWIHLLGQFEVIYGRMQRRKDHFMSPDLLQSQFDVFELPTSGMLIHVDNEINQVMEEIKQKLSLTDAGLIGIGVMGTSLARNLAGKGMRLSLYNRFIPGKEEEVAEKAVKAHPELKQCRPFENLAPFIQSIARPRKIIVMVNAGPAVEEVLGSLKEQLDPGDAVIEGGNSHYLDTIRRAQAFETAGIHYLGTGISGGEEGALKGPSIMAGGSPDAYDTCKILLELAAARNSRGEICAAYLGQGGAGHFVKMVHNGIEYAEMQLIADMFSYLRQEKKYTHQQISDVFRSWNASDGGSYLLEITAEILLVNDLDGQPLVDKILDVAGSKGTGSWASVAAIELGVPSTLLTSALFARYLSSFKKERITYANLFQAPEGQGNLISDETLYRVYMFCRIINHHQGFVLIKSASDECNWGIHPGEVAKVWSGGCIIRSILLDQLREGFYEGCREVLDQPDIITFISVHYPEIQAAIAMLTGSNLAYPICSAALDYFKSMTTAVGNAGLIQAQRDCFGAHTYLRFDDAGARPHHSIWIPTND